MSTPEPRRDVTSDDYRRAVVDAFLYYLSSHSRENSDLLAQGVKQGLKEWLDEQSSQQDQKIALHAGEVTEFHEALEEIYTHVDDYGRACREYGRLKAISPGQFISDDSADVYEAEKQLKLKIEQIVNANIRLTHMLEATETPPQTGESGTMVRTLLRDSMKEWLNERKGDIIG